MAKKIQEFVVSALRIDQRCNPELRKVLGDEFYFFNKRCVLGKNRQVILNPLYNSKFNLYGSKLNVNTIVGKNGSGKSSLLEMMYRIVNNFSSLLVRNTRRGGAYPLYFINGLWAELYYVVDNGEDGAQLARLSCQGDEVVLKVGDDDVFTLYLTGDSDKMNQAKIAEKWDKLFYTIVTNYSVQSFISGDFKDEEAYRVYSDGKAKLKDETLWMSSLFHKNDGYLTPIVLNPYRDEFGNMDTDVERRLTISRLTSILEFYKAHKVDFLEGYRLHNIRYQYDLQIVVDKYIGKMADDDAIAGSISQRVWNFHKAALTKGTYANVILNRLGFLALDYSNLMIERAAAYLVYKVLSIAKTYPTYAIYQIASDPNQVFDKLVDKKDKINLDILVDEIQKDKSHITLKIRQTIRFLKNFNPSKWLVLVGNLQSEFTFEQYQQALGDNVNARSLTSLMEQIPPSFFVPTIYFDKIEKGKVVKTEVPLTRMSSGERQYLYNFTTIIYHVRNLLSVQDSSRVRYRAIHLVFDEVEICFHPEYQRKFINSLLSIINRTRINGHCAIQITIATHSPFILSDVPQDNILYLEEGHDISGRMTVNPFGANINDVLQQSFFLENGFVGEFAQSKINSLIDYLQEGKHGDEWNIDNSNYFIENVVGEPIIKGLLHELWVEKKEENAQNTDNR